MVALDGVRGVAILLVLVGHFASDLDSGNSTLGEVFRFTSIGWVGVDLFFVLSGFLITGILWDTRKDPAYYRNFYMRRVLRIFPLYYGVLTVALVVAPMVGWGGIRAAIGSGQPYYWLYGVNLLILITGSMRPLAHLWSLAVEEHFYLAWPLLVGQASRRTLIAVCLGLAVAALLTRALMRGQFPAIGIYVFTACRMDALLIGALGALLVRGPGDPNTIRRAAAGLGIGFGAALGVLVLSKGGLPQFDRDVQIWGYSIIAAFFGCVVLLIAPLDCGRAGWLGGFLGAPKLRAFGKYSYGSYVLHPFIMGALNRLVPSHRPGESWGVLSLGIVAYLLAGVLFSQAAAYVSWHLYEQQFLKWKKYFEYGGQLTENPG